MSRVASRSSSLHVGMDSRSNLIDPGVDAGRIRAPGCGSGFVASLLRPPQRAEAHAIRRFMNFRSRAECRGQLARCHEIAMRRWSDRHLLSLRVGPPARLGRGHSCCAAGWPRWWPEAAFRLNRQPVSDQHRSIEDLERSLADRAAVFAVAAGLGPKLQPPKPCAATRTGHV